VQQVCEARVQAQRILGRARLDASPGCGSFQTQILFDMLMFRVSAACYSFERPSPSKKRFGGVEMRARRLISVALLVSFLTVSGLASAHHNATSIYEPKSIILSGTVTQYEWANPHSIISVAVTTNKGTVEQWHGEFLPPAEMVRAGWSKETIKPGDQVTMTGRPGRHAQRIMWLESLVTADGRKLSRKP
jgi:Family of unknown function (DUF6152)